VEAEGETMHREQELSALTSTVAEPTVGTGESEPRASRRKAPRLLGAAAAGGAAALVVGSPAAADNGLTLLGANNSTANRTRVDYTGTGGVGFLFQAGTLFNTATPAYPAALAGFSTVSTSASGVYGYTNQPSGSGVVGLNAGGGFGVKGESAGSSGVYGKSVAGDGVVGESANVGGSFTGGRNGIVAVGTTNIGVQGFGRIGGFFSGAGGTAALQLDVVTPRSQLALTHMRQVKSRPTPTSTCGCASRTGRRGSGARSQAEARPAPSMPSRRLASTTRAKRCPHRAC